MLDAAGPCARLPPSPMAIDSQSAPDRHASNDRTWKALFATLGVLWLAGSLAILVAVQAPAEQESSYIVDDMSDLRPALYRGQSRTVVIFTRSNCSACQSAVPDLAAAVAAARALPDVAVVAALVPTNHDREREFAAH